mmetsp:Transcript_48367/g.117122  ORF Transcript_48367/g.117122 Transcript_48367/m.117122 type:complete len:99 (+) Transcript_48367:178-474(+)
MLRYIKVVTTMVDKRKNYLSSLSLSLPVVPYCAVSSHLVLDKKSAYAFLRKALVLDTHEGSFLTGLIPVGEPVIGTDTDGPLAEGLALVVVTTGLFQA